MKQSRKALACALAVSALLAQSPVVSYAAENEDYSLDQVVVTANRVPTKVSEAAANVTVITGAEIEKNHYHNLGEVLRNVSGVYVSGQGYAGAGNFVRINGDDRVLIMIDGVRMNMDKGAASGRAGYDLKSLPTLTNVERIEIVKGAASALYGSDAVGGVINIITKAGGENSTNLDVGAGSWGTKNYEFSHQGQANGFKWFLTAGKNKQDHFKYKDYQSGDIKTMDNSYYDKNNVTFRLDKEIDDKHSLTLNFEHLGDESGQPYMVPGRVVWGQSMHYPNDYKTDITNNIALTYDFNKGTENAGYLTVNKNYFTSDYNKLRYGKWDTNSYSNTAQGVDYQKSWKLDDNNALVGGFEWRDTNVSNSKEYDDKTIINKALYLEDRVRVADKWTITPGLRYDHHNMFGSKTTPKAAINYDIDNKTNVYASWSEVFNAPNADDLFWPDNGYTAGNPNLKPETGHAVTLGLNSKLTDKTTFKASVFKNQLTDAINWAPDVNGKWMPSNVDEQRKQGCEISLINKISPNWTVETAYTYTKLENKSYPAKDYTLDEKNSQPNAYKLSVNYDNDAWGVGLTGTGAAGRSLNYFTKANYWVWDAVVNYKINSNTNSYVKVNNITNVAYENDGNPASNGGTGAFPMPARNYEFGIKYKF